MSSGIKDLAIQLGVAFTIILLGYSLRAAKIFTANHAAGLSKFCTFIALPGYLFLAMLTLEFNDVQWGFFGAVFLAKSIVGLAVASASLLLDTTAVAPMAAACMRIIMTTFSNDYALGAPVLLALYPPPVSKYLFVIAPVSLLIINPICLVLTEISATKHGLRGDAPPTSTLKLAIKVLSKPVVSMVILGLVLNPAFGGQPPTFIKSVFAVIGHAFAAPALFNIGGNMHGKFKAMKGKSLFAPSMLICSKIILLPIIIAMLLPAFGVTDVNVPGDDGTATSYSLTLFGFIYGSLPSATAVFFLAWEFGILLTESTTVIVIGTLSAAPLMLIAAQVADLSIHGVAQYQGLLQETAEYASMSSLIGGLWLLGCAIFAQRLPPGQRLSVPAMATAIVVYGIGVQTCENSRADGLARYMVIWIALSCLKATIALNVVSLTVTYRYGSTMTQRLQPGLRILALVLAAGLSGLAYARLQASELALHNLDNANCWIVLDYRHHGALVVDIVVNALLLGVMVVAMVKLMGSRNTTSAGGLDRRLLNQEEGEEAYALDTSEDGSLDELDERDSTRPAEVSFRDLVFVSIELTAWVISVFAQTWLLAGGGKTKIFVMVAFLEVFLLSSQGVLTVLIFGTKRRYTEPVARLVRYLKHRPAVQPVSQGQRQVMDPDFRHLVEAYLTVLHQLAADQGRDGTEQTVTAAGLVTFLVGQELVSSRDEAVSFGLQLQRLGYVVVEGNDEFDDAIEINCKLQAQ
eukprot:TRINITY_DN10854_c0_g3_i1.p1 TRINITY_DN10854_c0_g3~~TRINITY_DN10854_c0_g3_i1.p1  ORF type:complete len:747 (+),score=216.08 TRINITY_DN10854_c0_g3_i1:117-2357(+)